ncbi:MAG: hypothetical protein NWQ38_04310 [Cellulophaga sp.]|nr:hypothetical protein [Cellulophaga sp.]
MTKYNKKDKGKAEEIRRLKLNASRFKKPSTKNEQPSTNEFLNKKPRRNKIFTAGLTTNQPKNNF